MHQVELRRDHAGGASDSGDEGGVAWYAERLGVALVVVYALLACFGVLAVAGAIAGSFLVGRFDAAYYRTHPFRIPPQLLVYALVGSLTYVFTALAAEPDAETRTVLRFGSRVPVALLLVFPAYVLFVSLPGHVPATADPEWTRQLAGMAFLLGLFVEHAVGGFRTLAEGLILGRIVRPVLGRLRLRQSPSDASE